MTEHAQALTGFVTTSTKACTKCGESKPLDDFYPNPKGVQGRSPWCKACDNARPRTANALKINRNRARHRAVAALIAAHEDEFTVLYELKLAEATEEAKALAANPKAAAAQHGHSGPVRLRPGPRMVGQGVGDRIDVARCSQCVTSHDRGHVCPTCGAAPGAPLKRIAGDGLIDEVAVERVIAGDTVSLTPSEWVEVVRRMAAQGYSDEAIAQRLRISSKTVSRWRAEHNIESRWTA